ncbi:hypothetical protein MMPV_003470 [Pyropia vietnamensis]
MDSDRGRRQRPDEDRIILFDILAQLGDRVSDTSPLEAAIESRAKALREDVSTRGEVLAEGLLRCGLELPVKASTYATLAGLLTLGEERPEVTLAHRLAGGCIAALTAALKEGSARRARRALRYLSELALASVVSPTSFALLLVQLLTAAVDDLPRAGVTSDGATGATDTKPAVAAWGGRVIHARAWELADVALSVLPWSAGLLTHRAPDALARALELGDTLFSAWDASGWAALRVAEGSLGAWRMDELRAALTALRAPTTTGSGGRWQVKAIMHAQGAFDIRLSAGQEVSLPEFTVPSHSRLVKYAPPAHMLRVLSRKMAAPAVKRMDEDGTHQDRKRVKTDVPEKEVAGADGAAGGEAGESKDMDVETAAGDDAVTSSAESFGAAELFVVGDLVTDILDNFTTAHVRAASGLLALPSVLTGVEPSTVDAAVVEGVLSCLLTVPSPSPPAVYYGCVFMDLCKARESRLPIKLLAAVEALFMEASSLTPESFDRLTEWFAYHLSHFGYKWNWDDWAVYADPVMVEKFPHRATFCRDVLARCVRASYVARIQRELPKEMGFFFPPAAAPSDAHFLSDEAAVELQKHLLKIVTGRRHLPPAQVAAWLSSRLPTTSDGPLTGRRARTWQLVILARSLLRAGCKTLSHFDTVAERYVELLRELAGGGAPTAAATDADGNGVDGAPPAADAEDGAATDAEDGAAAKRALAREVARFWAASPLHILYVMDKLCTLRVLDYASVLRQLLSTQALAGAVPVPLSAGAAALKFERSWLWDALRLVLRRAAARLDAARTEALAAAAAGAQATEAESAAAGARIKAASESSAALRAQLRSLLDVALRRLALVANTLSAAAAAGVSDSPPAVDALPLDETPGAVMAEWSHRGNDPAAAVAMDTDASIATPAAVAADGEEGAATADGADGAATAAASDAPTVGATSDADADGALRRRRLWQWRVHGALKELGRSYGAAGAAAVLSEMAADAGAADGWRCPALASTLAVAAAASAADVTPVVL